MNKERIKLQSLCLDCRRKDRRSSWGRRVWQGVCYGKAWGCSEKGLPICMVARNGSPVAGRYEARSGGNPPGKKATEATRAHTYPRRDLETDASPPRNREQWAPRSQSVAAGTPPASEGRV